MKIALDIDDVLAGFYQEMCKKFKRIEKKVDIWDGQKECAWISKNFMTIENDIIFWTNLPRLSNPNSINFKVECYITSSPESMIITRYKWLINNGFPIAPVFYSKNKLKTMIKLGIDILIDDKPETIDIINNNNKIGLQFKPGYMSAEIKDKSRIITHLNEVNNYI